MTKQEEIREGIWRQLIDHRMEIVLGYYDEPIKALLNYLQSQGVVLKVERELPKTKLDVMALFPKFKRDMFKAGYVAVEPLIQEIAK